MTDDQYTKAKKIKEAISDLETDKSKLQKLYASSKVKTLTSEDIEWLIQTCSDNQNFILTHFKNVFKSL